MNGTVFLSYRPRLILCLFIPVIIAYQQKQASWCDSEATKFVVPSKDILGAGSSVSIIVVLIETRWWGNIVYGWLWCLRLISPFHGPVSHSFEPLPILTLVCCWQRGKKLWEIFSMEIKNKYCIPLFFFFFVRMASNCSEDFTPS